MRSSFDSSPLNFLFISSLSKMFSYFKMQLMPKMCVYFDHCCAITLLVCCGSQRCVQYYAVHLAHDLHGSLARVISLMLIKISYILTYSINHWFSLKLSIFMKRIVFLLNNDSYINILPYWYSRMFEKSYNMVQYGQEGRRRVNTLTHHTTHLRYTFFQKSLSNCFYTIMSKVHAPNNLFRHFVSISSTTIRMWVSGKLFICYSRWCCITPSPCIAASPHHSYIGKDR